MAAGIDNRPVDHSAVRGPARDHAARADEMMKRIQEGKDPYGRDEQSPAQEQAAQPPAANEPPANEPPANEPPAQEQAAQPPAANEPPKNDGKPEDFEQKYRSLKGSFDGLRERFNRLSEDNEQLRRTIANLEAQGKTAQPPAPTPSAEITDEERAEYGPEFFEMLERVNAPLRAELAEARRKLSGIEHTTVQTAREKMHAVLDDEVSNWKELNVDDDFKNWLALPDEASGQPRQNLLIEAYGRNEAARVAYFFRKFLSEVRGEVPQSRKGPDTKDQGRAQAPAGQGLERFAGTGKGRSAAAPTAGGDKPTFTTSQITQFYADKRTGKYRGREAEADRMEREIFDAQGDNRIRAG